MAKLVHYREKGRPAHKDLINGTLRVGASSRGNETQWTLMRLAIDGHDEKDDFESWTINIDRKEAQDVIDKLTAYLAGGPTRV